jgi:ABC-2 type transport system permease protein
VVDNLRAYLLLARMWSRAAWQYRASLVLLTVTRAVVTGADLVVVAVLFAHTARLGGFRLPEVMFLYGTSYLSTGLADLALGNVGRLGQRIRTGTFDTMLVRPVGTLVQVAAEDFTPRRAGTVVQGAVVFGAAVGLLRIPWDPLRILMVVVMVASGAVIFGSIWVLGGAFQFVATDAAEVVNSFTSGGNLLTQYPLTVFGKAAMRLLTCVVPLAFVNWQPSLYVLGKPDPLGLPGAVRFASPAVAAVLATVAGAAWRLGVRHYRSTGS